MFQPEALGLSSAQYQQFATSLVTPALGFLFLFLLGLPLKKIPFIDAIEGYTPPAWVLPSFALGSLFSLSLFTAITICLSIFRSHPVTEPFLTSFMKVRDVSVPVTSQKLTEASFSLIDYDQFSNFRLITNGYRLFGSSADCLLIYQCKPISTTNSDAFNQAQMIPVKDSSIHHIHSLNSLPFKEDIKDHLIQGRNFIDIFSDNSGLGDCRLDIELSFRFQNDLQRYRVKIQPDTGKETTAIDKDAVIHTFYAGGDNSADDALIHPYDTRRSYGSYRVCERIRLIFDLTKHEIEGASQSWTHWIAARHRTELCEILNYGRPYCKNP